MSRLFPHPLLSVALVLMWLILTRFTLGHLILGTVIAMVAGRAMGALEPSRLRLRRFDLILKLLGVVSWDIMRSNIAVAKLILTGGRHGERKSGFIHIPLTLRHPTGLAALSIIITATPGTAWLEYDSESGLLLLHVFDLVDDDDWRALIHSHYEAYLLEIFQ